MAGALGPLSGTISPTLRVALVAECGFALAAVWRDASAIVQLCAAICADKQMTLADVAHDNTWGVGLDVALALVTVWAVMLARRRKVASAIVATIPVALFGAILVLAAISDQMSAEAMQAIIATFLVPVAACVTIAVDSVKSIATSGRTGRRSLGGLA